MLKLCTLHGVSERSEFTPCSVYSYSVKMGSVYYLQAGVEPIHIAAQHGQIDVVRLLVEKYKVSTDNSTNVC